MDDKRYRGNSECTIDRRTFLRGTAATLPLLYAVKGQGRAQTTNISDRTTKDEAFPGLILREKEPLNLESPLATLNSVLTPNEQFYIRNHFSIPKLEVRDWRLKVEGAVERPLTLTYDDLMKMPSRAQVALLECAGNCRGFLTPKAKGVQWELGAVSNAEWTGVPLAALLDRAGVSKAAVEVILEGADKGEINQEPKSPGTIPFVRSLPLKKARRPEALLAYRMNGKELSAPHGFPLRAVVAGWYGMASVKWLSRIVITDRPFQGYFQTLDYSYFERRWGLPNLMPITEMDIKSEIARPARHEIIPANSSYRIYGATWAGESEVTKVDVSLDGGETWTEARLLDKSIPYSWRRWEHEWRTPSRPGHYTVMARATDQQGRVQPPKYNPDCRGYRINYVLPTEIEVR